MEFTYEGLEGDVYLAERAEATRAMIEAIERELSICESVYA
jgi:hypothetical protein